VTSSKGQLKCNRCYVCNGYGCPGNLPGLGGVFESKNFQLNCGAWKEIYDSLSEDEKSKIHEISIKPENLRCGPVTGAVENIGYNNEEDFYYSYLSAIHNAGFGLCVGDGCPDLKIQLGIAAVKKIMTEGTDPSKKIAAFFLKPYPQERLFERIEWVKPYASYIGIDIDSYNILTMRNLVNLERKTENQLEELRTHFDVPFVIKGVFTEEDIELVRQARPDVVYISNHGGRVETRIGSTADFLKEHASELKKYCKEIWVDGGIRNPLDVKIALYLGADQVIAARPFIRAVFDDDDVSKILC